MEGCTSRYGFMLEGVSKRALLLSVRACKCCGKKRAAFSGFRDSRVVFVTAARFVSPCWWYKKLWYIYHRGCSAVELSPSGQSNRSPMERLLYFIHQPSFSLSPCVCAPVRDSSNSLLLCTSIYFLSLCYRGDLVFHLFFISDSPHLNPRPLYMQSEGHNAGALAPLSAYKLYSTSKLYKNFIKTHFRDIIQM